MIDINKLSEEEIDKQILAHQAQPKDIGKMSEKEIDDAILAHQKTTQPQATPGPSSSAAEAALQGFGQGVSFGYLPQIQAATEPVIQGALGLFGDNTNKNLEAQGFNIQEAPQKSYLQRRDEAIQQQQQVQQEHPTAYMGGQLGGMVTGTMGTAGQLGKLAGAGIGSVASALPETELAANLTEAGRNIYNGAQGSSLFSRLGQAATMGATQAAITNPGDVPGQINPTQVAERLSNAETGAATGAVFQRGLEGLGLGGVNANTGIAQKAIGSEAPVGRQAVQDELGILQRIAKEQNLPAPTEAMATQGNMITAEKAAMNIPFVGKKIREEADTQVAAVRKNLEKEVGDFINNPTSPKTIGETTRTLGEQNVELQKNISSNLYNKVAEQAGNAQLGIKTIGNNLYENTKSYGLFGISGEKLPYSAESGLKESTFNELQRVVGNAKNALISPVGDKKVHYDSLANVMRTVKEEAKSASKDDPRLAGILGGIGRDLESSIQRALNRESPGAGATFREASKQWAKFKSLEDIHGKLIGDKINPEDITDKVLSGTNNVVKMKELIGEDSVKNIGMANLNEKLSQILPKSGIGRAQSAIDYLKKNSDVLKESIGEKPFQNILDNLTYLKATNEPINISRESAQTLWYMSAAKAAGAATHAIGTLKEAGRINPQILTEAEKNALSKITPNINAVQSIKNIGAGAKGRFSQIFNTPNYQQGQQ